MTNFMQYFFVFIMVLILSGGTNLSAQVEKTGSADNAAGTSSEKTEDGRTEPVPSGPDASDADKLIHYGDLIDVDVLGTAEYDWRGKLTPEGFLDGIEFTEEPIYGLCRTVESVARDIARTYSRFLNEPQVRVTVLDRSERPLSTLFGAVRSPHRFRLKRTVRLSELIVLAGGLTEKASGQIRILRPPDASCAVGSVAVSGAADDPESADPEMVRVRQDNRSGFIDIQISELLSGKTESNPQIRYGDIINVLSAEPVYIIGGVVNPSKIAVREGITVSRAIAAAGGLTKRADRKRIRVFRREAGATKVLTVDLNGVEEGTVEDMALRAYDIVDVPEDGRDETKYPPVVRDAETGTGNGSELPIRIVDR